MNRLLICSVLGIASVAFGFESDAQACGGCFAPQENPTVVSDHRMILTISKDQSTLYDQIKYSGSPASFAWVLPIAGTVDIGLSSDLLFSALDQQTQTRLLAPPQNCPPPPPGCGFQGSSSGGGGLANAGASPAPEDKGVTVLKNEVVGPYDTVQLAADDPQALNNWLTQNGYAIPPEVQPVIDAYVTAKFNFLALKLVPGKGIQDMRPVRVTTTGAGAVLPLRMVAAGTGATVGIGLWVLGEGRYEPQNFASFVIDANELTWDWTQAKSNYTDLRAQKTAAGNGRIWEIESSTSVFEQTIGSIVKQGTYSGSGPYPTTDEERALQDYLPVKDGQGNILKTAAQVRDEDLTTLFYGIDVLSTSARVTRLRADLAHAALDQDLQMSASMDQSELSSTRQITREVNQPQCPVYNGCTTVGTAPRDEAIARSTPVGTGTGSSCAVAPPSGSATFMVAGFGVLGVALTQAMRRRRR
jgi:MYXO-CTERM domain-containing protein